MVQVREPGQEFSAKTKRKSQKKKWKEVTADSIERLRIADEARELTAKAAERLARLEKAEAKKQEILASSEAYEREKMRLLEIQQALGQRFRDY